MQKKSEETMLELPSPDSWWTPRRKAAVIEAVRDGRIPIEEACRRYHLSADEFQAWERDLDRYGVPGLRSTRYQIYRDTSSASKPPLPRQIGPGTYSPAWAPATASRRDDVEISAHYLRLTAVGRHSIS